MTGERRHKSNAGGGDSLPLSTTGNQGLDALADAIAERVFQRLIAAQERNKGRLLDVRAAAEYIGLHFHQAAGAPHGDGNHQITQPLAEPQRSLQAIHQLSTM